jgi:mono/diheme cytochrome c family protein
MGSIRARELVIGCGAVALGLLAAACGGERPAATTPDAAYEQSCASCHGTEAQGTAAGPPLVGVSEEQIRTAVTAGVATDAWPFPGMPAVAGVSPAELDLIVAHLTGG